MFTRGHDEGEEAEDSVRPSRVPRYRIIAASGGSVVRLGDKCADHDHRGDLLLLVLLESSDITRRVQKAGVIRPDHVIADEMA